MVRTWNEEFEFPNESYSVWDIYNFFEYIFKKCREKTGNPSIRRYVNKIGKRIKYIILKDIKDIISNF